MKIMQSKTVKELGKNRVNNDGNNNENNNNNAKNANNNFLFLQITEERYSKFQILKNILFNRGTGYLTIDHPVS